MEVTRHPIPAEIFSANSPGDLFVRSEIKFALPGADIGALRRVLIDERGETKGVLKQGEHKSLQTDRVILMPGPIDEVAWVNQMFRWVIDADVSFREIALR